MSVIESNPEATDALLPVPPLIVALDLVDSARSFEFMFNKLDSLPEDISSRVGVKIPRWHDQDLKIRTYAYESGRFVVLDSQLHDGVEEMSTATRSLLSVYDNAGRLLLPHAITLSPAKETIRGQRQATKEGIFDVAHSQERPVQVFSRIDQTRLAPTEDLLHEEEASSCLSSIRMPFDAFELHADTLLSDLYLKKVRQAGEEGIPMPTILASRLGHGVKESDSQRLLSRIARTYLRGAQAVYIGKSILNATNPRELIELILESHDEANEVKSNPDLLEDFLEKYPYQEEFNY